MGVYNFNKKIIHTYLYPAPILSINYPFPFLFWTTKDHKQLLLFSLFVFVQRMDCNKNCKRHISMVQFNYIRSRFSQLNLKLDFYTNDGVMLLTASLLLLIKLASNYLTRLLKLENKCLMWFRHPENNTSRACELIKTVNQSIECPNTLSFLKST